MVHNSRWTTGDLKSSIAVRHDRELVRALVVSAFASALGCSNGPESAAGYDREVLLDPETCVQCHPGHYDEWSGSMHAYASEDPVFLAMNRRGQEETEGQLGDFCVNCHAPVAVREGLTTDGLNLQELPQSVQGITCYFCHNVASIDGDHNNPLVLANDHIMRGPFQDAFENQVHASTYASHLDSKQLDSAALCGSCHDVTLNTDFAPAELKLERTFSEWQETLFARPTDEGGLTCSACHMPTSPRRERTATLPGTPQRHSRRHDFEAVDLAITPFANQERQQLLVERFLGSTLLAEICVSQTGTIELTLENAGSGHYFPSGATHDREVWVELKAYTADDETPLFETLSPEAAAETETASDANPQLLLLKDKAVTEDGNEALMFWDVAAFGSSTTIPGVITRDPLDPDYHRERIRYQFQTEQVGIDAIDRVTMKVRVRPIALKVLGDLVDSGHLEPDHVAAMPVTDVLPNRCYDQEVVQQFSDILGLGEDDCEGETDGEFTLVWRRSQAQPENANYRETQLDGSAAGCLSHPTYVPPATM